MMIKFRLLFFAFVCSTINLSAQSNSADLNLWTSFDVKHQPTKKIELTAQFLSRFDKNITQLNANYFSLDASRKLGNGLRLLFESRFSTSSSWDKLRFGIGFQKSIKLDSLGKSELKIRGLYQYQYSLAEDIRYGIELPQQNFRLRISWTNKIFKKTYLTIQSEPMWRSEDGDFFFRRVRSNVSIKRLLPGPWSIELGYTRQINFNNPSNINILTTGVSYEWKKKTKPKKNPINPLKVSPSRK
jgi:hypothetical protein